MTAMLMCAGTAHAATLYVQDKLVLSVYEEPNQSSTRIATIETGEAVEELERIDRFVRVQLANGRDGWVGANYLSREPPAIVRLKSLEAAGSAAKHEPSKQHMDEVARLKKQNDALQAELGVLRKKLQTAQIQATQDVAPAPPVHKEPEPVQSGPIEAAMVSERSSVWGWLLPVVAAGACGFAAGYQTLGSRVRAKFCGVKVY
jgi:hypothetical protein